jgi:hypothetical protein
MKKLHVKKLILLLMIQNLKILSHGNNNFISCEPEEKKVQLDISSQKNYFLFIMKIIDRQPVFIFQTVRQSQK